MSEARAHARAMLWVFCIGALLAIPFLIWPQIDIWISSIFWLPEQNFHREFARPYRGPYLFVSVATKVFYITLLVLLVAKLALRGKLKAVSMRVVVFFSLSLAAGPWLGVHHLMKDGFERPRPRDIVEFGGEKQFVSALHISDQGGSSFVSGHAAMGFYLASFALLAHGRRRQVMYGLSIAAGLYLGYLRVVGGGHFFSDVLFSGVFILMVVHGCYALTCRLSRS